MLELTNVDVLDAPVNFDFARSRAPICGVAQHYHLALCTPMIIAITAVGIICCDLRTAPEQHSVLLLMIPLVIETHEEDFWFWLQTHSQHIIEVCVERHGVSEH